MSRVTSHIQNLVYTTDDNVVVSGQERAKMNRLIRKFCRNSVTLPENTIGFLCLGTINCNTNLRKNCRGTKACAEVGDCEKDRQKGSIHYIAYNYVAEQCRRQKVAFGNCAYFKDVFGYEVRYLRNTRDGEVFAKYRKATLLKEKAEE